MTAKDAPGYVLQDMIVVEKPQDIRLIYSKKHNMILKLVMEKEMSISDISKALNLNPGSVHYHLKELEKRGFVRQVREEIKGGVVKKYYRSAARRFLLDAPDFNGMGHTGSEKPIEGRLIEAIEYMGYHLPPENRGDAEDMLSRYHKRISDIQADIRGSGLDNFIDNGAVIGAVSQMMLILRAKEDPELDRIYGEFNKLFKKYG